MFFQGPISGDYEGDLVEIATETSSEAPHEWGPIRSTAENFVLIAGETYINRYSTKVDGLSLTMPTPADGMVVNLKEVIGWSAEGEPFPISILTGGDLDDPREIESPLGLISDSCLVADPGIFCRWIYDGVYNTWRLTTYFKPTGPA
jgi:hypothetical protein